MKKQHFYLLFLLFFFFLFNPLFTQNKHYDTKEKVRKIDSLLKELDERNHFNGNILVAENGKIILEKPYGFADPEKKILLQKNSCYQLASISKQFTAVAIMILKEKGKLNYEDTITQYLPDLPYYGIKIKHLLSHTSGLPDYMNLFRAKWDTINPNLKDRKIAVNSDVIEMLRLHRPPILFKPGEKYEYSNTGYLLLASIVEKASGREFDKFLDENIFKPLKMKNTIVYSNIKNQPIANRAFGYQISWDGETCVPSDIGYLDGTCGDKGVYSNTEDLFKWDRSLYKEKILKHKTLKEAFTRFKLNNDSSIRYGYGWFIDTIEGKAEVWHTGTWYGFRNRFLRQIDENNTIIVLSSNTIGPRTEIVNAINDILHYREYKTPKMPISLLLGKIIKEKGIEAALLKFNELKENKTDKYSFEEDGINSFGFRLLRNNMIKEAIEIFKLNVLSFPESDNVYDSLAEAYLADGNEEYAIINFAKSLALNPKNISAVDKIIKLTNKYR